MEKYSVSYNHVKMYASVHIIFANRIWRVYSDEIKFRNGKKILVLCPPREKEIGRKKRRYVTEFYRGRRRFFVFSHREI